MLYTSFKCWYTSGWDCSRLSFNFLDPFKNTCKCSRYIWKVSESIDISLVRWQVCWSWDMKPIESLQHRATKYILNDYTLDYQSRLIQLKLLPLSMQLELNDICFFIKSSKLFSPNNSFNISMYTHHSVSTWQELVATDSLSNPLLRATGTNNSILTDCLTSGTPCPQSISVCHSAASLQIDIFWDSFLKRFNPDNHCSYLLLFILMS